MSRRSFFVVGAAGGVAALAAACGADLSPAASSGPDGAAGDGGATPAGSDPVGPSSAAPASTTSEAPTSTDAEASTTGPPVARFVVRGDDGDDRVALTFHTNGDTGLADRLLGIVGERGAPITCFLIGNWLDANPGYGERLVAAGHEIANHTYTHPTFGSLGPAAMEDEIRRCRDALQRHTGTTGRFFRPSGTDDGTATPAPAILRAAAAVGYGEVLGWDVEPYDYQDPGGPAVRQRVLDGVRPGSVVSLHFGHAGTVEALPGILDGLEARGLRPVTASALLGSP